MTTHTARRCFFVDCATPAMFRFWRLWNESLPVQYCCAKHVPGSLTGIPVDKWPDVHQPTGYYPLERIPHAP